MPYLYTFIVTNVSFTNNCWDSNTILYMVLAIQRQSRILSSWYTVIKTLNTNWDYINFLLATKHWRLKVSTKTQISDQPTFPCSLFLQWALASGLLVCSFWDASAFPLSANGFTFLVFWKLSSAWWFLSISMHICNHQFSTFLDLDMKRKLSNTLLDYVFLFLSQKIFFSSWLGN